MPIRADQLKEKDDYQRLIVERLVQDNDYRERPNTAYRAGLAMDTDILLEFLDSTQHKTMEQLRRMYKERTEETVINTINNEINKESRGLIDVIKNGVEFDNGATLKLMYRRPDSTINTDAVENYKKNIFTVMQEVYHKADERVDLVIFLNGIAIFTIELKCNTSGQNYEDAINQYKNERDPDTRLFKTRVGVLAAFAMDLTEVYFTTELKRRDTFFNPFNIGVDDGKGNPINEESGIRVSYMWESIWTKDQILFLLERFIYIKKKTRRDADTGREIKSKELIFPRFHQLRAVERVMNDVIMNHTSCNYLIEHSAGSGKTETISWLAHILATVHDAENKNVFDNMKSAYELRNHFTLGNYNTTITRSEFEEKFAKTRETVTFTFGGWDGKSYDGESRKARVLRCSVPGYEDVRFIKVGKGLHYIMEDKMMVEKATSESHPEAGWLVDVERA